MSQGGVDEGDMADPELSDEQLARILDGTAPELHDHPVVAFVDDARRELAAHHAPSPTGALEEYVGVVPVNPANARGGEVLDLTAAAPPAPRRSPVFTTVSAFIGTIGGKILVGSTVAAASVAGAHGTGLVDVPGLPDDGGSVVEIEQLDEPEIDTAEPDGADDTDETDDADDADDADADRTDEVDDADETDDADSDDADDADDDDGQVGDDDADDDTDSGDDTDDEDDSDEDDDLDDD